MILRTLVLAAATAFAGASIKDCDSQSIFRPTDLAIYPDPPVRGEPVYMTVKFQNPGAEVTDGKVTTAVTLNGLPLSPSVKTLCEDTVCPIVTGLNDRSTSSVWPSGITGRVASKITWTGPAGESLLCLQTSVSVSEYGNTTMALIAHPFAGKHNHPNTVSPKPRHSDGPKPAPPAPKPAPPHPAPKPEPKPKPIPHHSYKPKPRPHSSVKPNPSPSPTSAPVPPSAGTTGSGTTGSGTTGSGTTGSGTTGSGTTGSGGTTGSPSSGQGPTININIRTIINGVLRGLNSGTTSSGTTSSGTTSSGTTSSGSTYLRH
jgi:hypothetical protein